MERLSKPIDADIPLLEKSADQLGYVVPDLEQAIKGWIDQGIGPWLTVGPVVVTDNKYLERPSRPLIMFGFVRSAGCSWSLFSRSTMSRQAGAPSLRPEGAVFSTAVFASSRTITSGP